MPIQIGFSKPIKFNLFSWLVRKITKSECSHAWFLYFDEEWQAQMVLEATDFGGFRIQSYERFQRINKVVAKFTPKYDIDVGLRRVGVEFLGSHYDFKGFFGMFWVMLGTWLKRKLRNPMRSSKNVFCSEAVTLAIQWSPQYEWFKDDPQSVTPQDLLNLLRVGFL